MTTAPLAYPSGRRADLRDGLLLLAIVAVLTTVNGFWLAANRIPPHWDQANHMLSAFRYHDTLATCFSAERGVVRSVVHCARTITYIDQAVYAPLFPLTGGLMIFLAGSSIAALVMTNVPFLILLVSSIYGLGRHMRSRATGVIAAMLICAYPLVFVTTREFMLELALLSLTAASAYLLVLSNRFENRRFTLLFGVASGLALLTKFTYLPLIAGLCLYEAGGFAFDVWRGRISRAEGGRRLASMSAAALIAVAMAASWYFPNRQTFFGSFANVAALDSTGAARLTFTSLTFYAKAMARDQMGLPLFGLFVFGLFRLNRLPSRWRWLLIAWASSIYVFCTVPIFKSAHHAIGILIPAAIISAVAVASLARLPRRATIAAVTAFACWQLAVFSLPERVLAARVGTLGWSGASTALPQTEQWPIERLLVGLGDAPARVVVVSDHPFVNGTTAQFYASKNGLPLEIRPCWMVPHAAAADFRGFDFVIAKSDDSWVKPKLDGCFYNSTGREDYAALLRTLDEAFVLARSETLPDGSALLAYRVTSPQTPVARIE